MAGSVNKVILIGNLGRDPEVRYTQSGKVVANFSLATTETWGTGEDRREQTEWHNIVVWGRQAEHVGQYLNKGRRVYVEGRLQTRKWQDRDGNNRYTTEVVAQNVVFLDPRGGGGQGQGQQGGGGYGGGGPDYGGGGGGQDYGYNQGGNYGPPQGDSQQGGGNYPPPGNAPKQQPAGGGYDGPPPMDDDDDIPF